MTGSALFSIGPGSRPRRELVPGAVHVPSWLTIGQQRWITERFDERALAAAADDPRAGDAYNPDAARRGSWEQR